MVIEGRIAAWSGDAKMVEYLRPQTLFGTKFESYLQAATPVTAPKKVKLINCKECVDVEIAATENRPRYGSGDRPRATTVSQAIILENDAIAKALLTEYEKNEQRSICLRDGERVGDVEID